MAEVACCIDQDMAETCWWELLAEDIASWRVVVGFAWVAGGSAGQRQRDHGSQIGSLGAAEEVQLEAS